VLPCFIAHDTPELEDSIKMVLLNGHPCVAEKLLACLLSTAAVSSCPTHVQAAAAVGIEALLYAWPDVALRRHSAAIWDTLIALSCATRKCVREPWERAMNAASQRQSADSEGEWSAAAASVRAACARSGVPPPRLPATPAELLPRSPGITPSPRAGGVHQEPMSASADSEAASVASVGSAYSAASWTCILGGADSHTGLTPMLEGLDLMSPPAQPKPGRVTFTPVPWNLAVDSSPLAAPRTAASPVSAPLLSASPERCVARGSTSTTAGARMVAAAVLVLGVALLATALLSPGREHPAHMLSVRLPTCDGTWDEFSVEPAHAVAEEAPLAAQEPMAVVEAAVVKAVVVGAVVAPAARTSTALILVQSIPEEPVETVVEEAELVAAFELEVDAPAAPEADAAVEAEVEAAVEPQAVELEADVAQESAAKGMYPASGSEFPEKVAAGASASSPSSVTESSVANAPAAPEEEVEAEPRVPTAGDQVVDESAVQVDAAPEAFALTATAVESVVQVDVAPVAFALTAVTGAAATESAETRAATAVEWMDVAAEAASTAAEEAQLDSDEEHAFEAMAAAAKEAAARAVETEAAVKAAAMEAEETEAVEQEAAARSVGAREVGARVVEAKAEEAQAPLALATASPAEALNTSTASAARVAAALRSEGYLIPRAAYWAAASAPRLALGAAAASTLQLDLVWAPLKPRCPAKCGLAPNNVSRAVHGPPALELERATSMEPVARLSRAVHGPPALELERATSMEPVASYNASRTYAVHGSPLLELERATSMEPVASYNTSRTCARVAAPTADAAPATPSFPTPSASAPPLTPVYAGHARLSVPLSLPAPPLLHTPVYAGRALLSAALSLPAPPLLQTPVYAGRPLLSAAPSLPTPPLLCTPAVHQSVALFLVPSRAVTVWAPPMSLAVASGISHARATSAVRGRALASLALVCHVPVAEPHARFTLTARPFASVPPARPTSLLAAAIRASTQPVAVPSVPAAAQHSLAVPLLRAVAAVSTLASSAQPALPPPAATLGGSTLVSRPALLLRPFLVPEGAPACASEEAEEEKDEASEWEATARAAARAILKYQPLLRAAVLAGSLLSLLGLVLLHALGWGGEAAGGKGGKSQSAAAAAGSTPTSKGANAAALLREVSIGTPVAVARAAQDAAMIEESGVSALKALAGRTPVRIRGSVASLLRGLAQATPPSAAAEYISFEARDAEDEQEAAPKALIGLLAATETPA